jgi:predicted RNA-binding Zn-ribbon protein involved in translation (DUF1610 family)
MIGGGGYFSGACPECGTSIYVRMEFLTLKPVRMAYTCPACDAFILTD